MLRYAIVDDACPTGHAARLAAGHVDYVQLRAKSLPAGELAALARALLAEIAAVPNAPTRLLINTRADVALATAAHGVHLTAGPGELTPAEVRSLFTAGGASCTVSVSCHTLDDVRRAHAQAADLILFGPVFEKRVAGELVQPGLGLRALEDAVRAAPGTPVLALGGITQRNAQACLDAGAAGIAAIRLFARPKPSIGGKAL